MLSGLGVSLRTTLPSASITISSKSISESAAWSGRPGRLPAEAERLRHEVHACRHRLERRAVELLVVGQLDEVGRGEVVVRRAQVGHRVAAEERLRDREAPFARGHAAGEEVELDPERKHRLADAELAERMHEHVARAGAVAEADELPALLRQRRAPVARVPKRGGERGQRVGPRQRGRRPVVADA